jgi:hypothetical protein
MAAVAKNENIDVEGEEEEEEEVADGAGPEASVETVARVAPEATAEIVQSGNAVDAPRHASFNENVASAAKRASGMWAWTVAKAQEKAAQAKKAAQPHLIVAGENISKAAQVTRERATSAAEATRERASSAVQATKEAFSEENQRLAKAKAKQKANDAYDVMLVASQKAAEAAKVAAIQTKRAAIQTGEAIKRTSDQVIAKSRSKIGGHTSEIEIGEVSL